jgi:undecaprenyl diphosphate synthase
VPDLDPQTAVEALQLCFAVYQASNEQRRVDPATIDDAALEARLYEPELPDPDLVIRTSGEQRLSNFLLWQTAYSELVFVDDLWPDFGPEQLRAACAEYAGRRRRFGGR